MGWLITWVLPVFVFIFGTLVVLFVSKIPFLGTLLYGVAAVIAFNGMALPLLRDQSMWLFILVTAVLVLALLDCVYDLIFTAQTKSSPEWRNKMLEGKWGGCYVIFGIGALVCYYPNPGDQSRIEKVLAHYGILMFLLVVFRAFTAMQETYATITFYPEFNNAMNFNDFFSINKIDEDKKENLFYDSDYNRRYVELKRINGLVVCNAPTIEKEKEISSGRLDKMYPKKFLAKAAEFFAGDKETLDKRENAAKELAAMKEKVSYISDKGFREFSAKAEKFLRQVSSISPRDLLETKFPDKYRLWLPLGVEFFLIEAFASGVSSKKIVDEDKDDNPMVNHAYRHTKSIAKVKVTNANENPVLALD
jgi:hypothetical protein